ncbi:hypothetical protein PWT90_09775 [Aphanocladium album]|nr:hypothetical protein PWT90_09775 [Aphanocladium album]
MNELGTNIGATAAGGAQPATQDAHDGDSFRDFVGNLGSESDQIYTRAPEEPFRLTFTDVTCLLVNRTIGTGIFNGPREVMRGAQTPGMAMLIWFCGCIYCLAGSHVFLEYGLTVPRYVIDGVEQSVPRSGGELHYLQYVYSRPRYKKDTIVLISVMFGLGFICVGNMASNCIDCASKLLILSNSQNRSDGLIRGIAIFIATVTCFIHAFSRRGGILLNNLFAVVKLLFLVSIILITWVVVGGKTGRPQFDGAQSPTSVDSNAQQNDSAQSGNGQDNMAEAFLFVVFAFFGFDQPSYVLGEIKHPRKNFPKAMWWGMGLVSVLYLAVNFCYMLMVPADVQMETSVAVEFFARAFPHSKSAVNTVNAFLVISSFGNVVVWTFTAARMKQEIAKQCYLPFSKFFAMEADVSLGRFLTWLEGPSNGNSTRRISFLNPSNHREKTPVGAFTLHLMSCIVLICATFGTDADHAYSILSSLFSYLLAAWFGVFLAAGILILHIRGPPATQPVRTPKYRGASDQVAVTRTWREITKGSVNPTMSIICAVLYLIGSLYPIIARWVPPGAGKHAKKPARKPNVAWFVVPVAAICILAFSILWFLGFLAVAKYRQWNGKMEFSRVTQPEFDLAERRDDMEGSGRLSNEYDGSLRRLGGLILSYETVYPAWTPCKDRDSISLHETQNVGIPGGGSSPEQRGWHEGWQINSASNFHNNDFFNDEPPGTAYTSHAGQPRSRPERYGSGMQWGEAMPGAGR